MKTEDGGARVPRPDRHEYLEYMADLLNELEEIAVRNGCQKLAEMLSAARAEAIKEAYIA